MPNEPSGPLLFVIGLLNVAALHWRGYWQKGNDLISVTTSKRNLSPVQARCCGVCPMKNNKGPQVPFFIGLTAAVRVPEQRY